MKLSSRMDRPGDPSPDLLRQGIVFVQGRIDQERSNVVIAQLLFMDGQQGGRPVSIYINSPDGDLRSTLAIYDTMLSSRRISGRETS
jgi:ATP-dependent Clp protease protease subunit